MPLDFIECFSLGQIGLSSQLTHWAICLCSKFTVKLRVLLFYTNIKSPLTDHDAFVSPQHLDEKIPAPPSQSNSHTYWLKSYLLGCNGLCYIIISHKTKRFPSHDRCRITGFYITLTVFSWDRIGCRRGKKWGSPPALPPIGLEWNMLTSLRAG